MLLVGGFAMPYGTIVGVGGVVTPPSLAGETKPRVVCGEREQLLHPLRDDPVDTPTC